MDLGTLADVVSAVATVGALIAAVVAGVYAAKLFRVEVGRDIGYAEEAEKRYAQDVSAWVAAEIGQNESELSYGVVIVNASSSVIYDVRADVHGQGGLPLSPLTLRMLPPGQYYVSEQRVSREHAYPWAFARSVSEVTNPIRPVTKSKDRRIAKLTFRDSANRVWERQDGGMLRKVSTTGLT